MITNDIVSINARDSSDTADSDTLAKFGGYDPEMYDATTLKTLKTKDCCATDGTNCKVCYSLLSQNWLMQGYDVNQPDAQTGKIVDKTVHFNTAVPFMYIPAADYTHLTKYIGTDVPPLIKFTT